MTTPSKLVALLLGVIGATGCPDVGPRLVVDGGRPDAGSEECVAIRGECGDDARCCDGLSCDRLGACTDLPRCEEDDEVAGTVDTPAPIDDAAGAALVACREGLSGFDVFEIPVSPGDLLKLRLTTGGVTTGPVGGVIPDIDLWLFASLPSGVTETAEGGVVPFGGTRVSLDGVTANVVEQVVYEVPSFASGSFYAVIVYYQGVPLDAPYTLDFERRRVCDADADCASGFCRVDYDERFDQVLQQCDEWEPPGCGDGPEEAGADIHAESDALALAAVQAGRLCRADLDVFSFDKAERHAATVELEAAELDDDFLAAYLVSPRGGIFDTATVSRSDRFETIFVPASAPRGRWLVYVDQLGFDPDDEETSYELRFASRAACRTDADCAPSEACGVSLPLLGFAPVCAAPDTDACGETDADNFATTAPVLMSGDELGGSACPGALDWVRVRLPHLHNAVELALSSPSGTPVVMHVFAPDGTSLGAALDDAPFPWIGRALPGEELHVAIEPLPCIDLADCSDVSTWTLGATVTADEPCDSRFDCRFGDTFTGDGVADPVVELACGEYETYVAAAVDAGVLDDAGATDGGVVDGGAMLVTTRACLRPAPIQNLTGGLGDACFDDLDCAEGLCFGDWCTMPCSADTECEALLAGGYCFLLSDPEVCAPPCDRGVDCWTAFEGGDDLVCSSENRCVP